MSNQTRIVVETYYDEQGAMIGELVIESDDLEFRVIHYGKAYGTEGKRSIKSTKHYTSEGGVLRYLLSLTLKETKHETIEALLDGLGEITQYIREKTDIVVAAREPQKKRSKKGVVEQ